MTNFIELLGKTTVSISPFGVTSNHGFDNNSGLELVQKLKKTEAGEKDGSHFLRTGLKLNDNGDCLTRSNSNTVSLASILVLDCDKRVNANGEIIDGAPDPYLISQILIKLRIGHILYGSYSHYAGQKGNRYRIILLTTQPYTSSQLPPTIEALISLINSNIETDLLVNAKENSTWAQPWYLPRKPANSSTPDLYIEHIEGETVTVFDPLLLPPLSSYRKPSPANNGTGEISPIHAFNQQYALTDQLILYGYKKVCESKEYQKWLSPHSKSGAAGITVKDDKFYSHHDDAFNDSYWHDAFDLMRISEKLTDSQAVVKASKSTIAPNGLSIDEYNKSLFKGKRNSQKNSNPIPHTKVLNELLDKITKINFRKIAAIQNDDEKLKRYHYYIIAVDTVLEAAKTHRWDMCRNHDFIYLFNGAYWNFIDKDDLKTFLGKAAEKMGIEKFYARDFNFREQLYKQFVAVAHLPKPEQPKDTVYVNLKNGTFEITPNGTRLKTFSSDDFLTYQLPFSYDSNAVCPLFQCYLDKVLPDKQLQMILAEFVGYIFIRTGTLKLEKALLLYGKGANGKSVFYEIIRCLLGEQNTSEYSLQSLTDDKGYQRAMIANKLVNYASEINGKLEANIFKQLVSGEAVEARLPYGNPFIMTEYAKLVFNCNELPRDVEQTPAYFRRFLIIPFNVTIPEHEQDKQLAKKIIETELSGVFNWVLDGLNRLLQQKDFTYSNVIQETRKQYERESDSVKIFLEEESYRPSSSESIEMKLLYPAYKCFCIENGYKPVNNLNFKKRLEGSQIVVDRTRIGNVAYLTKNPDYSKTKWGE